MIMQETFAVKDGAYSVSYSENIQKNSSHDVTSQYSSQQAHQNLNTKLKQLNRQKLLEGLKTLYG